MKDKLKLFYEIVIEILAHLINEFVELIVKLFSVLCIVAVFIFIISCICLLASVPLTIVYLLIKQFIL